MDWNDWWEQGNNTMSMWLNMQGFKDKKNI